MSESSFFALWREGRCGVVVWERVFGKWLVKIALGSGRGVFSRCGEVGLGSIDEMFASNLKKFESDSL